MGRSSRVLGIRLNRNFAQAGYDVSLDHWIIINCVLSQGGKTHQDLSFITGRDKTAITRLIDQMEERNIVLRVPDQLDRRIKRVHLTHHGKQLHEELLPIVRDTNEEAEKGIDGEEMTICKKVLKQLLENTQKRNQIHE